MPDAGFFQKLAGGDDAFLAKKQFQGKILRSHGTRTTTGVAITVTPANGKTFYIMGGKVAYVNAGASSGEGCSYQVRNNAVVREQGRLSIGNNPGKNFNAEKFSTRGDSLDGTGALDYDVNFDVKSGTVAVSALLFGFIEDTGDDPLA